MNSIIPSQGADTQASVNSTVEPFSIVGIGVLGVDLEPCITLLNSLDASLGMAYVVLQVKGNQTTSLQALKDRIQGSTKMPVYTVSQALSMQPNSVYVVEPGSHVVVEAGKFKLAEKTGADVDQFPVDHFLMSLAHAIGKNTIGVLLFDSTTDGALGLKAIKAEGGITFALAGDDTEKSASVLHRAFIDEGVDLVLPAAAIAKELTRIASMPYTTLPAEAIEFNHENNIAIHAEELKEVLSIIKARFGVDFYTFYKHASTYRRIMRRMTLHKLEYIKDYIQMLQSRPEEASALYDDFLINVTSFFRDPDFFTALKGVVFPTLMKTQVPDKNIRIWVAGCSTGEEAYSIAISLLDFLKKHGMTPQIQIFASDLDNNALETARLGIYSASALEMVPPETMLKHFVKTNDRYQISKEIRNLCIFSKHDLISDPPFSKIDLVSCQNVLIYLKADPQEKILHTFHYALQPDGYLFLGKSETIGISSELFDQPDTNLKLYTRKSIKSPVSDFKSLKGKSVLAYKDTDVEKVLEAESERGAEKLLLTRYVPPSIVLNKNLTIVKFFGSISPYLEPVTGKASLNVLKIIRSDLVIYLGSLLQKAKKHERIVSREGIIVTVNGVSKQIAIEVTPIRDPSGSMLFLAVFKESYGAYRAGGTLGLHPPSRSQSNESKIVNLEQQLTESRGLIRASNEQYETIYEELQAYNEEILSSNEELQSVNEELVTSKEELQAAIEELSNSNDALQRKNSELRQSKTYAEAIVDTVHSSLLVLTNDFKVHLANRAFYQTFGQAPENVLGMSIFNISNNAWESSSLRGHLTELIQHNHRFKQFEIRHYFHNLGEIALEVNAYILVLEENPPETLILLAFNNISSLLKANHDLKRANAQLAEFAFVSSHDLQEPLRKIQTFANLLTQPEADLNAFAKKYTEKIDVSSQRMSTLIRDLVKFSSLTAQEKMTWTVDLNVTIRNVLTDLDATIKAKQATTHVMWLPAVLAAPEKMHQLFFNLIDNALKFSKEGPTIHIMAEHVGEDDVKSYGLVPGRTYVAVRVSDDGIGFDQMYVSKLFSLFQTLDKTSKGTGGGIGLAVCKKIVEDIGGIIAATGKEDDGATFLVILPV